MKLYPNFQILKERTNYFTDTQNKNNLDRTFENEFTVKAQL